MVPILALIYLLTLRNTADSCAVYLAQSKLTNGVGVFAGKSFSANELIDSSHTLLIPKDPKIDTWTLANYVYATRYEEFSLVAFGVSMLLNHHNSPNTVHYTEQLADDYANERTKFAYKNGHSQKFETTRDVSAGEEFFTFYGENWFCYRQLSLVNLSTPQEEAISLEELEQAAVCLSDIYSESSVLLPDEKGVFTRVFIPNGHLVTVSPAIALPKSEVFEISDDRCMLINYCLTSSQEEMALLPITLAGMINNGANMSNVEIGVFEWTKSAKDSSPESTSIYLGYYARRDIHPHEELLLDYGVKWAESWELYESLLETWKKNALAGNDYNRPLFRTPIEILDPLFD